MKTMILIFSILTAFSMQVLATNPVLADIEARYQASPKVSILKTIKIAQKYTCTNYYDYFGDVKTQELPNLIIYLNDQNAFANFGSFEVTKQLSDDKGFEQLIGQYDKTNGSFFWQASLTTENLMIIQQNQAFEDQFHGFYPSESHSFIVCDMNKDYPAVKSTAIVENYKKALIPTETDLKTGSNWTCNFDSVLAGSMDNRSSENFNLVPYAEGPIAVKDLYVNRSYQTYLHGSQYYKAQRGQDGSIVSFHSDDGNQFIRVLGHKLIIESHGSIDNGLVVNSRATLRSVEDPESIAFSYGVCE